MTQLLAKAFEEAQKLPQDIQDELARQILDDMIGEKKWDTTLARSQDLLERLADEALEDLRTGRATAMGIDEL